MSGSPDTDYSDMRRRTMLQLPAVRAVDVGGGPQSRSDYNHQHCGGHPWRARLRPPAAPDPGPPPILLCFVLCAAVCMLAPPPAVALENGLGVRAPAMGWSTWCVQWLGAYTARDPCNLASRVQLTKPHGHC